VRVILVGVEISTNVDPGGGGPVDVETFCRRVSPRLVRTLIATTGDRHLAQEVTQEALARAWERWDTVSRLDAPEAWCYRVAINLATSQFRRRAALKRAMRRVPQPSWTIEPPPQEDPQLQRALATLPDQQRQVVALRFLADLSVDETAQVLRIPVGTVKSASSRALAALRSIIEQEVER
jgi:RNA polymerase sigma-70 factor (ECF subfamily)